MDLTSIRAGLASALGGLGYSPYPALPGSPELPAVIINSPESIEYHQTLAGLCQLQIPITLLVSSADMESAQGLLNEAVSYKSGSLVQVLEAYASELWSALYVVRAGSFYQLQINDSQTAYGVDLTVRLMA